MIIRPMREEDIPHCHRIVEENWNKEIADHAQLEMRDAFYSHSLWPPKYYVAVDPEADQDGEKVILGFAGYRRSWMMSNTYELVWINVAWWAQKQGIGRKLTEARIQDIRRIGGTMIMLMTQKSLFFEKFGFKMLANYDDWKLMVATFGQIHLSKDHSRV